MSDTSCHATPVPLHIVVLAAGLGTRMHSAVAKVLQPLAGRPMLHYVLALAQRLQPAAIHCVVGYQASRVEQEISDPAIHWVLQDAQKGTGHAVAQAMPSIPDKARVLVLYGDVPLLQESTLRPLVDPALAQDVALLTAVVEQPNGLGRIERSAEGTVQAIVEDRDASPQQRTIREINTGVLSAPARRLRDWLVQCSPDNSQGEFYLTDCIAMAVQDQVTVQTVMAVDHDEILGINNRIELARAERIYQQRQVHGLLLAGLQLADPARFDLRGHLQHGQDCFIDTNVIIEGGVILGDRVRIGANCIVRNSTLAEDVIIQPMSLVEQAQIHRGAQVGPFARLRPNTVLEEHTRVGNFVEMKNTRLGSGSKANHLSYLGDSDIGKDVNIGAGVITCNYDGLNKYRTEIGDGAFIGSDCQLVAPVRIGAKATIGAGTTLIRDAAADALTLSRPQQQTIQHWLRPALRPSKPEK